MIKLRFYKKFYISLRYLISPSNRRANMPQLLLYRPHIPYKLCVLICIKVILTCIVVEREIAHPTLSQQSVNEVSLRRIKCIILDYQRQGFEIISFGENRK